MKIFSFLNIKFIEKLRKFFWRGDKFVYVAIGDSTVEGVGSSHPKKSFPALVFRKIKKDKKNASFYNLGKSGARIKDVVEHQLPKAISLKPDLITISVGSNDLRHRTNLKHFEKDYYYLLKTLRNKTSAKIIISNIPDLSLLPSLSIFVKYLAKFMARRLNQIIAKHSSQFKCVLVDLYEGSRIYSKKYKDLISGDGFHPSDKGYSLWAKEIIANL